MSRYGEMGSTKVILLFGQNGEHFILLRRQSRKETK